MEKCAEKPTTVEHQYSQCQAAKPCSSQTIVTLKPCSGLGLSTGWCPTKLLHAAQCSATEAEDDSTRKTGNMLFSDQKVDNKQIAQFPQTQESMDMDS